MQQDTATVSLGGSRARSLYATPPTTPPPPPRVFVKLIFVVIRKIQSACCCVIVVPYVDGNASNLGPATQELT